MKTKHTKGDWYVAENLSNNSTGNRVIIRTDRGNHPQVAVAINYNTEANEANAKLIAAAPEMLESLTKIRAWYEENHERYFGTDPPIIFSEALSAILKATS